MSVDSSYVSMVVAAGNCIHTHACTKIDTELSPLTAAPPLTTIDPGLQLELITIKYT